MTNTGEALEMEVENKLAYALAKCYILIPWRKIGVKSAHKFFVDRIRASGNARNFKEFLDIFCRKINVEFVKLDKEVIDFLTEQNNITMMLIRKESTYLANFALETVDEVKAHEKLAKSGQTTL
jgi:hypothetical protein